MPSPKPRGHLRRDGATPFRSRPPGMSDQAMARVLARLDKLGGGADSPWPDQVAAHLSIDPMLTDDTLAGRFNVSAALVARVRANMAAGRPPGRGIDHDAEYPAQEPSRAAPGPAGTPEPVAAVSGAYVRNDSDIAPCSIFDGMPRFLVTAADGTVTRFDRYRPAMVAKVRAGPGATITVEEP
jgi:hypothetical protein